VTTARDARFMGVALGLGRRGWGKVWPNPAVGCVIAQGDRVVGRGWTQDGGRPHGETVALEQAGAAARGATAYVTLEPCAHTGQTPPCADALISAGIGRVVVAISDPDPRVAGRGIAKLRAAGIEVREGVLRQAAARDQRGFLIRVTADRPMVTLKLATSFDGRIATQGGDSQWITGAEARRFGHALRASHDAVLIGAGTARADDPTLTARDMGARRQPVRIVAARNLDLPIPSNLTETARQVPVWVVHGPYASPGRREDLIAEGVDLVEAELAPDRQIDMGAMMEALAARGLTRVYCEGGGALAASLLRAGLVDDLVVFTAGVALGAEGRPVLGALGLDSLAEAQRFGLADVRRIGPDTLTVWTRV